jgi:hypothetical protein
MLLNYFNDGASSTGTDYSASTDGITWATPFNNTHGSGNALFSGRANFINMNGWLVVNGQSSGTQQNSWNPGSLISGGTTLNAGSGVFVQPRVYSNSTTTYSSGKSGGFDPTTGFYYTGSATTASSNQTQIPGGKSYGVQYQLFPAAV